LLLKGTLRCIGLSSTLLNLAVFVASRHSSDIRLNLLKPRWLAAVIASYHKTKKWVGPYQAENY